MAMRYLTRILAFTVAATAAATSGAAAQTKAALTGKELERALADAGYGPKMLKEEKGGHPVASGSVTVSQASKINFFVRTRGCKGQPMACDTLIFFANFDLGRDVTPNDFRITNSYNDTQVFGRSYVLEKKKQVGIDYAVHLGGGVTQTHLTQALKRWPNIIQAFIQTFRSSQAKPKKQQ